MCFQRIATTAVLRVAGVRLFHTTLTLHRVSPYVVFLKSLKGDRKLKGLGGPKRGKAAGKIWKSLSSGQKAKFAASAARRPYVFRDLKKGRKNSEYSKFMRRAMKYKAIQALPNLERLAAVARLYKNK